MLTEPGAPKSSLDRKRDKVYLEPFFDPFTGYARVKDVINALQKAGELPRVLDMFNYDTAVLVNKYFDWIRYNPDSTEAKPYKDGRTYFYFAPAHLTLGSRFGNIPGERDIHKLSGSPFVDNWVRCIRWVKAGEMGHLKDEFSGSSLHDSHPGAAEWTETDCAVRFPGLHFIRGKK